ncbi:MAG: hypothetical protein HQM14_01820 [SAR324 cluster bacterium]|nr:hypothetical protein [SAR324 cluster bacterium]
MRLISKHSQKIISLFFMLSIVGIIASIPLLRGIHAPFTDVSDNDEVMLGQALLFNAGLPQTYFDHTAYTFSLLLSFWLKFAYWISAIPLVDMHQLLLSTGPFGSLFAPLVYSGRIFIIILAIVFVISFTGGLFLLTKDKILSCALGLLLATTQGIAIHSLVIRAELLSAYFFMLAVFSLLLALQSPIKKQIFFIFMCGIFSYLALLTKVQIVIGIFSLPFLALVFGKPKAPHQLMIERLNADFNRISEVSCIILFTIVTFPLLVQSTLLLTTYRVSWYHYFIVLYFLIFGLIVKRFFLKSILNTVTLFSALFAGIGAGFYFNFFNYNPRNHKILMYFVEHGRSFIQERDNPRYVSGLFENLVNTLYNKLPFISDVNKYAFSFIYLLLVIFCIVMLYKKNILIVLKVLSLIGLSLFLEMVFRLRSYASFYFIYTDFLLILGVAIAWQSVMKSQAGKSDKHFIGICLAVLIMGCFNWRESYYNLKYNTFNGLTIRQPPNNFCHMSYYNPPLGKFINYKQYSGKEDLGICEKFILRTKNELL